MKCPDLRVEVFDQRCKECKVTMAYGRWSRHVDDYHNETNSQGNIDDGNVQYYSVAEDGGTLTPDITSTNGLNNDLAIGDSVTVVVIIKPDRSDDKITNITIDNSAATEEWLGGSAPDGGASGSYDVYTFFILKTADATFLPLCNKVNYA